MRFLKFVFGGKGGETMNGETMNIDKIGQAAGALWRKLHEKPSGGIAFADLKKIPGFTQDEVLAGVGWLAREGKLAFKEGPQKKVILSLTPEEAFTT